MIQELADEHNSLAALPCFEQFLDSLVAKLRLQHVVKILLAEKVQPVAADASQQRVQQPSGKRPVCRIIYRPGHRQPRHSCAARPALGKTLRVPRKKAHRPQRA